MKSETRAWIEEHALKEIRGIYRRWQQRKADARSLGIRAPQEPTLTVATVRDILDQRAAPEEWEIATIKKRREWVRGVLDSFVRSGQLRVSEAPSERGTARAYDPVSVS